MIPGVLVLARYAFRFGVLASELSLLPHLILLYAMHYSAYGLSLQPTSRGYFTTRVLHLQDVWYS